MEHLWGAKTLVTREPRNTWMSSLMKDRVLGTTKTICQRSGYCDGRLPRHSEEGFQG